MTPSALRISLADVARLAQVKRPVVSVWRSRARTAGTPFPEALTSVGGQDWFDAIEVAGWLEATGRGNNPSARLDLAAFAAIDGGSPAGDAEVFAGLTALLCLSVCAGRALGDLTDEGLLELADEHDEDDDLLYGEIRALGVRRLALARYADLLADAAYTPLAAFESLMAQRFRLFLPGHGEVALTEPVHQLVGALVAALASLGGIRKVVDPTVGGSDLLIASAGRLAGIGIDVGCSGVDDPAARLVRRRLRMHDLNAVPLSYEVSTGGTPLPFDSVVVAQYPTPSRPVLSSTELLTEVDGLALQLHPDQFAVVVAPAAVLMGRLDDSARRIRSDLLRSQRVRAMVRLPAGAVRRRPRQQLALWILGPLAAVADGQSRVAAADLTAAVLNDVSSGALITDLVASLDPASTPHHPHFVRMVAASRLLERSGALLPAVPAEPFLGRAPLAAEITAMIGGLTDLPAPTLPTVVAGTDADQPVLPTTVGAAVAARALTVRPGHRLRAQDIGDTGTPVVGPAELTGGARGARRIDRLVFAGYPRGRYTEPGDIVFCTAPRPAAWVDRLGGSVVEYPARLLRVSGDAVGLSPHGVAHDLRRGTGNLWRAWPLRVLPAEQAGVMDFALAELRRHHDEILSRVSVLGHLADQLMAAAAAGTARLDHEP